MYIVQLGAVGFFMCFLPAFFFFGYGCVHRLVATNRQRDTEYCTRVVHSRPEGREYVLRERLRETLES
jgi:hypothetical protein